MTTLAFGGFMPTPTLELLQAQALQLDERERAELANALINSLDAPADGGTETAWADEITQRIAKVESGQARLLTREEFRRKIQARLGTC